MNAYLQPLGLLVLSNLFMTTAWYWHLKYKGVPIFTVITVSWGLAFFEIVSPSPPTA